MSNDEENAVEEGYDEMELGLDEGEEECEESHVSSKCSKSGLDAEARRRLTAEYRDVVMQIDAQNKVVDNLKMNVCELSSKPCRTKCEDRELRNLRCCLERENLKLQCLIKRAMNLQDEDPCRIWEAIPIATTFEEDSMPISLNYRPNKSNEDDVCPKPCPYQPPCPPPCLPCPPCPPPCQTPENEEDSFTKSDLQKLICTLMKKADKSICGACAGDLGVDEATLRKIACALQAHSSPQSSHRKKRQEFSSICRELNRSYGMQEKLAEDNADLEGDRYQLQEEILTKDKTIDCLQQKINCMQANLQQLCCERNKMVSESQRGQKSPRNDNGSGGGGGGGGGTSNRAIQNLEKNICNMESSMKRLKVEMDCLRKERNQWDQMKKDDADSDVCAGNKQQQRPKTKSFEIEELKNNYAYLLGEYAKKDYELKDLQKRVQKSGTCGKKMGGSAGGGGGGGGGAGNDDVDEAELCLLREKVTDMTEEQDEFKCLIKEQAEQLLEYQNKYLAAQQKVEEQKCILDKLEMNNKRIEDQINLEIQRIKDKFQEKLKELAQLPKLLENEQVKLAQTCKEKEELEKKLRLVCKELKSLRAIIENQGNSPDCSAQLQQALEDLRSLTKKYEDMQKERDILCEQYQKTKCDLDTLRTESAKIISRTKERSEQQRQALQERIDSVEKELAQCRATACLSISDREEVIKEMQGQLNTIAYSFDSAQKQIKTLKNHIAFLSHDDCPTKC